MNIIRTTIYLVCSLIGVNATAQMANDTATQQAILQALPAGVSPENATADEIAQAAIIVAFGEGGKMDGPNLSQAEMEANLTQVMVSLGELTRASTFKNAPRFGDDNPPGRFYTKVLNLASSNLDVSSDTYYSTTVQYIIGLTAAMREGQNFLNGAKANAITRK
jgi:hypothetical protein